MYTSENIHRITYITTVTHLTPRVVFVFAVTGGTVSCLYNNFGQSCLDDNPEIQRLEIFSWVCPIPAKSNTNFMLPVNIRQIKKENIAAYINKCNSTVAKKRCHIQKIGKRRTLGDAIHLKHNWDTHFEKWFSASIHQNQLAMTCVF